MKPVHIKLFILVSILFIVCFVGGCLQDTKPQEKIVAPKETSIVIPDTNSIPHDKTGDEIRYGRNLIIHTSYYLGPEGVVMKLAGNKMNCKNCHLDAGTRPYSSSYLETYLKYPQYRAREGMVLTIEDRINNCFERPMNGKILPYNSREMRAIVSYMRWLCEGKTVSYQEDTLHLGEIKLLDRPASVENGKSIYSAKCLRCHGADGQGQLTEDKSTYTYPPLWGKNSYAQGSSAHRLIRAARFVKWSMPYSPVRVLPQLTDEEAFDVVAFINCDSIHPRPYRPLANDCPDLRFKPIDFPGGPFLDTFPIRQHILGPFKPIQAYYNALK